MKKVFIVFLFFLTCKNVSSQETSIRELTTFNTMMDSLMITLWQQIKDDVSQDGYQLVKLTPDEIEFEGHIMIMEVFFTPRVSYILALFGVTDSMREKYKRQTSGFRFRRQLYVQGFIDYIEENRKIPDVYKITYKFIAMYHDSPPDHSIIGSYVFKMNEDWEFEISDRKIEVLRSKEEFQQKYNANF